MGARLCPSSSPDRDDRLWARIIVLGERDQRAVVDDVTIAILACHRGFHPIVDDLNRHTADRLEGSHVATQKRLQVLMQAKPSDDMPGMAESQGKQPDDPGDDGFILEAYDEAGEVDLGLMPRCGSSNRTSNGFGPSLGRIAATKRFTAV